MKILSSVSVASILVVVSSACGGNNDSSPTTAQNGTLSDAGTTTTDEEGSASGASGTFWFDNRDVRKVGVSDLAGNELWSESLESESPKGIVLGGGSAWVITDAGNVLRYDQTTHARLATIAATKKPSYLVFAGGALWVSDDNDGTECNGVADGPAKVVRIDLATNTVTARIAVAAATDEAPCNRISGLATDGTSVYALIDNVFGAVRIDASTNTIAARVKLGTGGGYGTGFLAAGGGNVWVHNTNAKSIQKLDPVSLVAGEATPVPEEALGENWVVSAEALYLDGNDKVLRVDATSPATQASFPIYKTPDAMALYKGALYTTYTESLNVQIATYNPTTLAEMSRISSLVFPSDIAFVQ